MFESPELRDELVRIRASFAVTRAAGLWTSRYPQSTWSELLGCTIREQTADGDLGIQQRPSTRHPIHCVGSALPSACSVWRR